MRSLRSLVSVPRFGPALILAGAPAFLLFASPRAVAADSTPVNVTIRSDEEALAKGFETAFREFKPSPIFLSYEREDRGVITLTGLRSVRAAGAVLIITLDRGVTYAVPARNVILLTDERPNSP